MSSAFRPYRRPPSVGNVSQMSDISSNATGLDQDSFVDVYRESQMNGFRRLGRGRGNGQFVQVDDDDTAGFIERSSASIKQASVIPIVEKGQLDRRGADLCGELRKILQLTEEFRQDVIGEKMSSSDLLAELASKIRPFLVRLDEEMAAQEETVKKNLDRCRITDQKVDWLLRHNKFMLQFRGLVERLTTTVYDELERHLTLKVRGVHGAGVKKNVADRITEIIKALENLENELIKENDRPSTLDPSKSFSLRSA